MVCRLGLDAITVVTWIASLSKGRWMLLLALIAILIRLPWAMAMHDRVPVFDEYQYVSSAESLCAGEGYVDLTGARSSFWPAGYPAFLALGYCSFGVSKTVGVGLQIILLALTCLLISTIGERSFGARVGRTAALLLAIYPNYIFYSTLMLTEPLSALLLVSMAGLLFRIAAGGTGMVGKSLGIGLLAGLATLVRPGFILLPMLLPLWGYLQKMSWRQIALMTSIVFLVSLLTMAPWMIRNHDVTGGWFEVASNGGYVFWGGNHPDALGGVVRPASVNSDTGVRTPEYRSSIGYRLGIESIASDIPATVRRSVQKLSYFFAIETDGAMWNFKGLKSGNKGIVPALIASFTYIAVMACGMLALLHGLRNTAFGHWFLLLAAYSIAIAIVFEADPRYHFQLIPFLMIYAAAGMTESIPSTIEKYRVEGLHIIRDPKTLFWLAAMLIFLTLIVFNLWLKTLEPGINSAGL
jgi:4-amino-4-deoxy-L-arabinose transferase-like glycosyltransferase